MKVSIQSTSDILIKCLQIAETNRHLESVLFFADKLFSINLHPDSTPTTRNNAMVPFLAEYQKAYERIHESLDKEELDLKTQTIHE